MKRAPYYKEANRIKNKMQRGHATREELAWLKRYKDGPLAGLPVRCVSANVTSAPVEPAKQVSASIADVPANPPEETNQAPDAPTPIKIEPIDLDGTSTSNTTTDNSSPSDPSSPKNSTAPSQPGATPAGAALSNPFGEKVGDAASAMYCGGVQAMSKWLKDNGAFGIPDELIAFGGVGAKFLAEKYLNGPIDPEKAAFAAVIIPVAWGAPGAIRIVQEKRARKARPIYVAPSNGHVQSPPEPPPPPAPPPPPEPSTRFDPLAGIFGAKIET